MSKYYLKKHVTREAKATSFKIGTDLVLAYEQKTIAEDLEISAEEPPLLVFENVPIDDGNLIRTNQKYDSAQFAASLLALQKAYAKALKIK